MDRSQQGSTSSEALGWILLLITGAVVLAIPLLIWPNYNVWRKSMDGKAQLAEAEANRQIAVIEAEAKKTAAEALGDAEIIRAEKLAEANKVLGASLQGNDAYLRYLWITEVAAGQDKGDTAVIYLPGDSLLPFAQTLETGRAVTTQPLPSAP